MRTRLALLSLVVLLAVPAGSTLALADTGSGRGADAGSGRGTDGSSGRGTDGGQGRGTGAGPGSGHHGRGGPGWGQPAAHHPAIGYVPPPGVPASRGRVPVRPDPTPTPDPSPATIRRPTAAPTRAPAVASASGQGPTAPAAGFLPVAGVAGGLLLFVAMVAAGFRARARLGRLG